MLNVVIFPVVSSWVWGEGWLSEIGYQDFGGSSFHIIGGSCGLVGAAFLGPRLGLFTESLPVQENKIKEKLDKLKRKTAVLRQEISAKNIQLKQLLV